MGKIIQPNLVCTFQTFTNPNSSVKQILITNKDAHIFAERQLVDYLFKWSRIAMKQLDINNKEEHDYPAVQITLSENKDKSAYIFSVFVDDANLKVSNELLAVAAHSFCIGFYNELKIDPPKGE